jgi:uncharacterized membrane protein
MDSKHWYLSKTMWAAIGTLIVGLLGAFGVDVSGDEVTSIINSVLVIIGALIVIIGRVSAKTKLTK